MDQNGRTDPEPQCPSGNSSRTKHAKQSYGHWNQNQELHSHHTDQQPNRPRTRTLSIDLQGKTTLVLKAPCWQSMSRYRTQRHGRDTRGTPDQIDEIRWEIYGILARHPEVTDPMEVEDLWMDDYASMHLVEDQEVEV